MVGLMSSRSVRRLLSLIELELEIDCRRAMSFSVTASLLLLNTNQSTVLLSKRGGTEEEEVASTNKEPAAISPAFC